MRHAGPLCTNWKRSPMVVQLHANWIQAHVHEQTRELEISEWQSMVQPTNKATQSNQKSLPKPTVTSIP